MNTCTPVSPKNYLIKTVFSLALLFSICVTIYSFYMGNAKYALAFSLGAGTFLLIAAGLLFTNECHQKITAVLGLTMGIVGFWYFPPWDNLPLDPQIPHNFYAPGFSVELQRPDGCVWIEQGRRYDCYLTIKPLSTTK